MYEPTPPYSFKIYPIQDFQNQGHSDKVKGKFDHDVAHLHPLTNVPSKYQHSAPYGF